MENDVAFWDNIAESYSRKPIADQPAYEQKLIAAKQRLSADDVVLDLGCGTGSLALELAPQVAHVHAVDISGEMLRIAERKAAEQKTDNVTFHRTNVDTLTSFEAASFDCVCAFNIIHLVDDPPVFLQRIFELLRPGGSLISTTPCLGESPMPYGVILKIMRWLGKAPAVDILKIADLDASLRSAGFVDLTSPDVGAAKQTAFILARKPA